MNWNTEQLRMLRALGHEPMRLATAADAEPAVSVAETQPRPHVATASNVELLAAAIARAAGGGDVSALALDLERLRREPALKRALWPSLRALRRVH